MRLSHGLKFISKQPQEVNLESNFHTKHLMTLTNRMLQHLEDNGDRNGNGNGHAVANGDVLGMNPQFYGLLEFKKM